ncbi:hypothetical protein A1Q1_05519 [Trichosporon asahii var. asahii CBS 2479]|uniref:Choline/carnitine acyltransferase domain-containing protein n=1 Tax=Trichosporon asahii var. asahii (strain ATCC 90039 / CBS 2479 / JCM 2466 / KCTC 7840 / NBRC 103889/ NCYC 2677 / UAMH 7654) TaxID=1186058 RepID=J4U718_TRIAS|nr:hypothetical protein A1Q1_05519 [Trichosporon asahii var. asahii CBS 2479]EJT46015.1 hypothetical protein A1Q1_05519 [Trichosporon asahii var. asahii CBS 2479]
MLRHAPTRATRSARSALRGIRGLQSTPAESTFSLQSQLPRLPIPTLEETATRYLKSLEPLLSAEEFKASQKAVAEFIAPNGLGPVLQQRLQAVDKAAPYSWLEDIWLTKAYLEWRDPSYINVNWAALIGDNGVAILPNSAVKRGQLSDIQVSRAARVISNMLEANEQINTETFPVDKARGAPLDMAQFKRQFGTTRIPKAGCDEIRSEWPCTARHILLMYRDVAVEVPVYNSAGERASTSQIEAQLRDAAKAVDAQIEARGAQPSVANLTAAHRDHWTKAREHLIRDKHNVESLDKVERALFGVCLDVDVDPSTLDNIEANWAQYAHGNYTAENRWFDKAIELIFLQNGRMGACCEHTPVDALTTGRLLFESLAKEHGEHSSAGASDLAAPQPINFNLDAEDVKSIDEARDGANKLASDLRCLFDLQPAFGAKWIKALGVSPDAFFQVALQAAYYRQHGGTAATYESSNQRKFLHGRTETIRSCTSEALAFSQLLDDSSADAKRKIDSFKHAAGVQNALTLAAGNGQGVDRHLLGLRCQMKPDEAAAATLFNDPAYAKSTTFILSTSNTGAGDLFRGGFAPVTGAGYGVNYAVDPKNIKITISDWKSSNATDAPAFKSTVLQTLADVQKLGEQVMQE